MKLPEPTNATIGIQWDSDDRDPVLHAFSHSPYQLRNTGYAKDSETLVVFTYRDGCLAYASAHPDIRLDIILFHNLAGRILKTLS